MLIFSPVTDFAVLFVFSRVGLFNFRQVRQLMIEIRVKLEFNGVIENINSHVFP